MARLVVFFEVVESWKSRADRPLEVWEIEIFGPLFVGSIFRVGKVSDSGFPAERRLVSCFCYVDWTALISNHHFSIPVSYYEQASSLTSETSVVRVIFPLATASFLPSPDEFQLA